MSVWQDFKYTIIVYRGGVISGYNLCLVLIDNLQTSCQVRFIVKLFHYFITDDSISLSVVPLIIHV